jgi:hypothetical protein
VLEGRCTARRWLAAGFGCIVLLLAGCASGNLGTVAGTFAMEAGPISPSGQAAVGPVPLSGVVRFTGASGQTVNVIVGAAGQFSVRLAPGTYTVTGLTAQLGSVDPHSSLGLPPCEMQNMSSTRVRTGQTVRITLICYGP